jgi:putative nucleotidyltransferase with HDIG domain
MSAIVPTRETAFDLFKKYNNSESLLKHALSVEGVMKYMARKAGEDEDKWGIVGLVHDLDYEMYPEQHCKMTEKILRENNWPDEYIRAVLSHGWGLASDVEPISPLEKTIYAMDELTGLVATSALVRPSKSVLDMEARSVKKKWNDKKFAAGVDRSVIEKGAEMLGVSIDDLITDCIMGMREVAEEIGLKGVPIEET